MADSLVNSYLKRLESLLIQEKEAFSGLEDHIEKVVNKLKEIGQSFDDANELRDIINDMENHIEKFLSQTDDRTTLTDCFRNDIQKIDFRLSETVERRKELKNSTPVEDDVIKGQASTSSSSHDSAFSFESDFENLSEPLRNCLMYCCIFPENFLIHKGKLIRLLVSEGLVEDKEGKVMEDIAEECIAELVNKGMLEIDDKHEGNGTKLVVPLVYRDFYHRKIEEGKLKASVSVPLRARRVVTSLDMLKDDDDHQLWSLFLIGSQNSFEEKSNWLKHKGAKFLRVLDLEGTKIRSVPDEVGDMTNLTYLCLKNTEISEILETLGNLIDLQTLDIRWCGYIKALPHGVLNLVNMRHLKMFKNYGVCGVKLPLGIGSLRNLLTLTGVDPSGGIGGELGNLTQLRRLGVMDVTEENINEVSSSIMKMQSLLSLSLEPKHTNLKAKLVLLDSFSPPLSLRKLRLEGVLEKTPSWLGSLQRLTNIRLGFSHLSEDPALVLQILPNLKDLTLWHAYDGKEMGKEFCWAGRFPKLEKLTIASKVLEEWTELEQGAFPSLKHLRLHSCMKLRMLPEGLQYVTALKRMCLIPLLDDHAERLKPDGGPENYKIKHIGRVSFFTTSMIEEIFRSRREEAKDKEDH